MSVMSSSVSLLIVKIDIEIDVLSKVLNIQESNYEGLNHKLLYSQATTSVDFYVST